MCQPDWATRGRSNVTLHASVRVLLDGMNFESVDKRKQMWVGLVQSVEGLNKTKRFTLQQVRGNCSHLTDGARMSVFFLLLDLN